MKRDRLQLAGERRLGSAAIERIELVTHAHVAIERDDLRRRVFLVDEGALRDPRRMLKDVSQRGDEIVTSSAEHGAFYDTLAARAARDVGVVRKVALAKVLDGYAALGGTGEKSRGDP